MKLLEAEMILCLAIMNADEEITDREIAFTVRHILSRYPRTGYEEAISLIREARELEFTREDALQCIMNNLVRRERITMVLSFMGIVFTDGADDAEIQLIESVGEQLDFRSAEIRRLIDMFRLHPDDFYDDESIIVIGSYSDTVNIPLIDNPATVLFYLDGEDLFLVVRSNTGMTLNSRRVQFEYYTSEFSRDSYLSFCTNRYTFDYWNILSFLRKEPGDRKRQYFISGSKGQFSASADKTSEALASVIHEKNLINITPEVNGLYSGSLEMDPGQTYRLYDREYIQSHNHTGVLQFVINDSDEHRVSLKQGLEINLGDYDSTLPETCLMTVQWSGTRAAVSVTGYNGSIRFDGDEIGSSGIMSYSDKFIISRLLLQLPENDEGEISIRSLRIDSLQADCIGVRFGKSEKRVLDDISFTLEAGELTAILGPAGSGKSTLLNALLGTQKLDTGSISINGNRCEMALQEVSDYMGFVPQDDLLIDVLTVRENLLYSYKLKNTDRRLPSEVMEEKINEVLKQVGLDHKKESRVGSETQRFLSGGERKRLNIALEIISDPDIIVLDEPTSGLSSMDAENLVSLLRRIANSGKLLLMVIHQPSSAIYRMFDNTLILNKDGRLAFFGSNMRALTLFSEIDADSRFSGFVECPTCQSLDPNLLLKSLEMETEAFWQVSRELHVLTSGRNESATAAFLPVTPLPEPKRLGPSERFREFSAQFSRLMIRSLRDTGSQILTLVISPILGFLTALFLRYSPEESYSFADNPHYLQYLFLVVVAAIFFGLSSSIAGILNDRLILKREQITRTSRGIYLVSKNLVILILTAIQCLLFIVPAQLTLGDTSMLFYHIGLMFVMACSTVALGLMLSTMVRNVYSAYTLVPFILIPQIILGGLFLDFEEMNPSVSRIGSELTLNETPAVSQLIHARWAFEMLVTANLDLNPQEKLYSREKREISRIDATGLSSFDKMILSDEVRLRYHKAGENLDFRPNISLEDFDENLTGEFLSPRRNSNQWISVHKRLRDFFQVTWKFDLAVLALFFILAELFCYVRLKKYPQ